MFSYFILVCYRDFPFLMRKVKEKGTAVINDMFNKFSYFFLVNWNVKFDNYEPVFILFISNHD